MNVKRLLPRGLKQHARSGARSLRRAGRVAPFWAKTPLYRLTPGGFGRYHKLNRLRDPAYDHERDKHEVRRKHFGAEGWGTTDDGGLARRAYEDYDEYVVHQQQKLDEVLKLGGFFTNEALTAYRLRFYRRFRHLVPLLPRTATIVCAGARQGTEVEVLRELGFSRAYGIDLNPGPDNPYVRRGDFHAIEEPAGSVDLVYSNSVDHAFDLDAFFAEHARVLAPDGYALYDLALGGPAVGGPAEAVSWLHEDVVIVRMLSFFHRIVRIEIDEGWKWVLLQGPNERPRSEP
ncbi:MAG: hypothetical protein QOD08_1019 [Gaiellaceae bacterium]|nr:hypothetical protein [Gaiellaceae bacterium]MDX6519118.1 hypothetical protein [Gaiellaceae bacterium]